jgi:hypothetical protein
MQCGSFTDPEQLLSLSFLRVPLAPPRLSSDIICLGLPRCEDLQGLWWVGRGEVGMCASSGV